MRGETLSFKRIFINTVAVLSSLFSVGFFFFFKLVSSPFHSLQYPETLRQD